MTETPSETTNTDPRAAAEQAAKDLAQRDHEERQSRMRARGNPYVEADTAAPEDETAESEQGA
jgi:hypothetical protein